MITISMANTEKTFVVDSEDFEKVRKFDWRLKDNAYPVVYNRGKHYQTPVHRLILDLNKHDGIEVDHVNRNKLDNRKENLRKVNRSQNMMNRGKFKREDTTSNHKGVRLLASKGYYQVRITVNRKTITIGHYYCEIASANMYNHYAKKPSW